QLHVLVIHRVVVDAALGRRDPGGHPGGLVNAVHQAHDVGLIAFARQPLALARVEILLRDRPASRVGWNAGPVPDVAAKSRTRQRETERIARLLDQPVPALDAQFAVSNVGAARDFVHGVAHWNALRLHTAGAIRQFESIA